MARKRIDNYITKAYERWLDYARFQCTRAGLQGQEVDVLNEVIIDIYEKKDIEFLENLLDQVKGEYTGLDAYVLRVIFRYAHMERANYRWKYCRTNIDSNNDLNSLAEHSEEDYDPTEQEDTKELIDPIQLNEIVMRSELSDFAKELFNWKINKRRKLKDWKGSETEKEVYHTYSKMIEYLLHRFDKPTKRERKKNYMQLTLKL